MHQLNYSFSSKKNILNHEPFLLSSTELSFKLQTFNHRYSISRLVSVLFCNIYLSLLRKKVIRYISFWFSIQPPSENENTDATENENTEGESSSSSAESNSSQGGSCDEHDHPNEENPNEQPLE